MRQALLVIVLVGAAFGGGAAASGPGFRWAQEHLLDYMGLQGDGEVDTLVLTPVPAAAEPLAGPAAVAAKSPPPAATAPPVSPPPPAPTPQATEPYSTAKASAPVATAPEPASQPDKPQGPAVLGALGAMLSPPKAPETKPEPTPEPTAADPSLAPAALPPLEAAPAADEVADASGGGDAGAGEWAEIRSKLDSAGVSHYTIEGEPGGRVVFACRIPLAGKQAVSQRFEAEGADEFQAARTVLKRITLWRVSHAEPAGP